MATSQIGGSPVDFIVNGLRKAANELEELQVQIALGKAEVKDIFENVKKELRERIEQLKSKIRQAKTQKDILPFVNALEDLQVQLALGAAETREAFEQQRKHILDSMNALESKLMICAPGRQAAKIQLELEKFKAKLQLISLKYQLRKISLEYDLQQKRNELDHKLQVIKTKLAIKEEQVKNKWQHFRNEIKEAFHHLESSVLPLD